MQKGAIMAKETISIVMESTTRNELKAIASDLAKPYNTIGGLIELMTECLLMKFNRIKNEYDLPPFYRRDGSILVLIFALNRGAITEQEFKEELEMIKESVVEAKSNIEWKPEG